MSYTRAAPMRTQTQTRTGDQDVDVKCTGHSRKATRLQAGPHTKNPGRWFYTCPLGRDDPQRCKFFKWEDEVPGAVASPVKGRTLGGGQVLGSSAGGSGQTLAQSPSKPTPTAAEGAQHRTPKKPRISPWFTPTKPDPAAPAAASTKPSDSGSSADPVDVFSDGSEDIDWGSLDTPALERDATEHTAHRDRTRERENHPAPVAVPAKSTPAGRLADRLAAAAAGKRKREEEDQAAAGSGQEGGPSGVVDTVGDQTPTRPRSANPFLEDTPTATTAVPRTPGTASTTMSAVVPPTPADGTSRPTAHPALGPVNLALEGLGEHLARQDRLVRAAEAMKKSMRVTIRNLQDRIRELENEVEQLKKGKDP